jgi:hypothetical protein
VTKIGGNDSDGNATIPTGGDAAVVCRTDGIPCLAGSQIYHTLFIRLTFLFPAAKGRTYLLLSSEFIKSLFYWFPNFVQFCLTPNDPSLAEVLSVSWGGVRLWTKQQRKPKRY